MPIVIDVKRDLYYKREYKEGLEIGKKKGYRIGREEGRIEG